MDSATQSNTMPTDEDPEIWDIVHDMESLSQRDRASHLLHAMKVSPGILNWSKGLLLIYRGRRIPNTSIVRLVDYVVSPPNSDVKRPRGYDTFVNGLAELKVNKAWIAHPGVLSKLNDLEYDDNSETDDSNGDTDEESSEDDDDDEVDSKVENEDNSHDYLSFSDDEEDNIEPTDHCDHKNAQPTEQLTTCGCCGWTDWGLNRTVCYRCLMPLPYTKETEILECPDCETKSVRTYDQGGNKTAEHDIHPGESTDDENM